MKFQVALKLVFPMLETTGLTVDQEQLDRAIGSIAGQVLSMVSKAKIKFQDI